MSSEIPFTPPTPIHPLSRTVLLNRETGNMYTSSLDEASSPFLRPRSVVKTLLPDPVTLTQGVVYRKSIGSQDVQSLDPFLLLLEFSVSPPALFAEHPHRGFESITYVLDGAFGVEDVSGHKAIIRTGDVQWMTVGKGIIHSEGAVGEGPLKLLQLWINLSAKDRMMEPQYFELRQEDIVAAEKDGANVRIIAGEAMGIYSPSHSQTPTMFLDVTLAPGAHLHQKIPPSWNSFAYVIQGEVIFGTPNSTPAVTHHTVVFSTGDGVMASNKSAEPARFLLVGGQPVNQPVVLQVPFVMDTQADIDRTIEDYNCGRDVFDKSKYLKSQSQC